jgi:amidase
MDLSTLTAHAALAAMARGELGSEELLDAHLSVVERHNGELNAVVALDARARSRCRQADRRRARGEVLGPLHGLPITMKDSFETEGLVTTCGSPALAGYVPRSDAAAVARLRAAGAIVYGKTNLPLYAADFQTANEVYGLSRNPWDQSRTVGGSSGGAAAALASGMTLLELGSDIGGSIRAPAHYNGVAGHKPTWGAVPQRGHIPGPPGALAPLDLGVVGPMARSIADLELALEVLTGEGVAGVPGAQLPPARIGALAGVRVGLWVEDPAAPTSRHVSSVLRATADRMADHGASIDDRIRPDRSLDEMHQVYVQLLAAAMGQGAGGRQSHREWLDADERRHQIMRSWRRFFDEVDVVIAPCAPVTAFPHDLAGAPETRTIDVDGEPVPYLDHLVWAGLATLPLLPATAVPVGCAPDGLPVGAQVIGPRWADRTTLAVARLVEGQGGGFLAPPQTATRGAGDHGRSRTGTG